MNNYRSIRCEWHCFSAKLWISPLIFGCFCRISSFSHWSYPQSAFPMLPIFQLSFADLTSIPSSIYKFAVLFSVLIIRTILRPPVDTGVNPIARCPTIECPLSVIFNILYPFVPRETPQIIHILLSSYVTLLKPRTLLSFSFPMLSIESSFGTVLFHVKRALFHMVFNNLPYPIYNLSCLEIIPQIVYVFRLRRFRFQNPFS